MGEPISIRSLSVLAHRFYWAEFLLRRLSWVPGLVMSERPTNTTKNRHSERRRRGHPNGPVPFRLWVYPGRIWVGFTPVLLLRSGKLETKSKSKPRALNIHQGCMQPLLFQIGPRTKSAESWRLSANAYTRKKPPPLLHQPTGGETQSRWWL